jgi:antitoxin component YwqK of YwqJK toxin-antitoxin module
MITIPHSIPAGLPHLLLIIILLASCGERTKKRQYYNDRNQLVHEEYFSNGRIKSSITYLDKKKKEYISIIYAGDGTLLDSGHYINDSLHGLHKYYEQEPGLLHEEEYDHGLLDGIDRAMYQNGVYSYEGQRKDGLKVGEWKFNYPDGRPITYEYYDSLGNVVYFRKYDDDGTILRVQGYGIIAIKTEAGTVMAGDTLAGSLTLAFPQNARTSLRMGLLGADQKLSRVQTFQPAGIDFPFTWVFGYPGMQKLGFLYSITDVVSGKSDESSANVTVTVLERPQ